MKSESRIKNSVRNATIAGISKVLIFVIQFICRTIFIRILSTEYLGVNGLFTNILMMLSFAELGIGSAIIFKLYKPIAEENIEKIKTYMNFYKKAYTIVGIAVLVIGFAIIPFLKYIINDAPNIKENLIHIYILFVINSSISYIFTYKKSIIIGHQKEYIVTIVEFVMFTIQNMVQILMLILTHNYIFYLIVMIISTFLINIICALIANKLYPYIKEKNYQRMTKEEEKEIFNDVKSLILYKIGYIISNGTDNMIISAFVGISEVGLLSNYTTITMAITSFLSSFFNGFTASIGNLNVKSQKEKNEDIYYQIILLSLFVYGIISISVILLINDFISLWLGKQYLLNFSICLAIGLNMFVDGMRFSNTVFRNTTGLFQKGKYVQLIASIINIILSLILVKYIGIFGVIMATVIARIFISTTSDPYLLHKYRFKTSCIRFYNTYIYYFVLFLIALIICKLITTNIGFGISAFLLKGILNILITFFIFVLGTCKMKEFSKLFQKVKAIKDNFK